MLRYKYITVVVAANGETVAEILASTEGTRRKCRRLLFEQTANYVARVYLDQDRIVDFEPADLGTTNRWIEIDAELVVGQSLKAGYFDATAGGFTAKVTVEYEEQ